MSVCDVWVGLCVDGQAAALVNDDLVAAAPLTIWFASGARRDPCTNKSMFPHISAWRCDGMEVRVCAWAPARRINHTSLVSPHHDVFACRYLCWRSAWRSMCTLSRHVTNSVGAHILLSRLFSSYVDHLQRLTL